MNIRIVCIGKLKESFYRAASDEFAKRLSRYATLEIIELDNEKVQDELSQAQIRRAVEAEGKRMLERIPQKDVLIATAIDGVKLDSAGLASKLDGYMNFGRSGITFVIGGSYGLSDEVLKRAELKLSFSSMTFTHQLFRIMLMEQVYRAFKILSGEPYHK